MAKTALLTVLTGRDGSYLGKLLLSKDYEAHRLIDPNYCRPAEVDIFVGDYAKAKRLLVGWDPKTKFPALVKFMVHADVQFLKKGREVKSASPAH